MQTVLPLWLCYTFIHAHYSGQSSKFCLIYSGILTLSPAFVGFWLSLLPFRWVHLASIHFCQESWHCVVYVQVEFRVAILSDIQTRMSIRRMSPLFGCACYLDGSWQCKLPLHIVLCRLCHPQLPLSKNCADFGVPFIVPSSPKLVARFVFDRLFAVVLLAGFRTDTQVNHTLLSVSRPQCTSIA